MVFHPSRPDPHVRLATQEELSQYSSLFVELINRLVFWSGPTLLGTFSDYSETPHSISHQVGISIEGVPIKELQKNIALETFRQMRSLIWKSISESAFEVPFGIIDLVGEQSGTLGRMWWGRVDPIRHVAPGFHHKD